MTTGATGGGTENKQQTDGEESKGGERDAHAGKLAEDMELGVVEYWKGERGWDQNHKWKSKRNT